MSDHSAPALSLACMPSDRTQAFFTGEATLAGYRIVPTCFTEPVKIFHGMVQEQRFDIAEMSLGQCFEQCTLSQRRFMGLPVFLSRSFRHGFVFINTRSGIKLPRDLAGKRIGVQHYGMSAAVWIRQCLRQQFDVDFSSVTWVEGSVNQAGNNLKVSAPSLIDGVEIHTVTDKSLSDLLAEGQIDAMIGAWIPDCFGKASHVQRLFADPRSVEKQFYQTTGIFPIMHALALHPRLLATDQALPQNIVRAFEAAKHIAMQHHRAAGALSTMLPWLPNHLAEVEQIFGSDCWPYGLARNAATLRAFGAGLLADKLIASIPQLDEVFLPIEP